MKVFGGAIFTSAIFSFGRRHVIHFAFFEGVAVRQTATSGAATIRMAIQYLQWRITVVIVAAAVVVVVDVVSGCRRGRGRCRCRCVDLRC